jgi:ADP-ribosylglycohydrolase
MPTVTRADRLRDALWGIFVGDALAMPVHWYYDVAALQRDFGTIRDYQAPKDFHPNSIMALASTGRAGRGSQVHREADRRVIDPRLLPAWA